MNDGAVTEVPYLVLELLNPLYDNAQHFRSFNLDTLLFNFGFGVERHVFLEFHTGLVF
jgi:hypothetical protein